MKKLFRILTAPLMALFLCFSAAAAEEALPEKLTVSLPETVQGFGEWEIRLSSPAAGEAEVLIQDGAGNTWRTFRASVSSGETVFQWDGLGLQKEKLLRGRYTAAARVTTAGGEELTASRTFQLQGSVVPTMQYGLPSAGVIYPGPECGFFVEVLMSAHSGIAAMEVWQGDTLIWKQDKTIANPERTELYWNGRIAKDTWIAPGDYTLKLYGKLNPEYCFTWPLRVEEGEEPEIPVEPTGSIMPTREMTDEEIWEIMMKPSAVLKDSSMLTRIHVYEEPSGESRSVGFLRGQTQAVEVLEIDGDWAKIHAWGHTSAEEITGYLPLRLLGVENPSPWYGILVDKEAQTLTVYEQGKKLAVIPVSTGLPTAEEPKRETTPGAFLTARHEGESFANSGLRYEYPLRYDGGNIIHGIGYLKRGGVRDYSINLPMLGQKASHGCIRVPFQPPEGCELNCYWLWTHIPYHTRVIVLP